MSSIMETRNILTESRSKMFLRSNSFQKLCSLAHPIRLKGFKSNKEALKSVFESLIVTTRGVIQSVTYRVLCFLFLTPFAKLLSRPLNLLAGKDGKLNTVRLILRLTLSMIVSTDKTGEKCDITQDAAVAAATDEPSESAELHARCVDSAVQTEEDAPPAGSGLELELEQYFDCKDDLAAAAAAAAGVSASQNGRSRERAAACPLLALSRPPSQRKRRLSLNLVVYGCVLCLFLQLSALGYLLNVAARIPPGLIFLISALGYIGYVMMRIFSSPNRDVTSNGGGGGAAPTMAVVLAAKAQPKPSPTRTTRTSIIGWKGLHPLLEAVGRQVASVVETRALVPIDGATRLGRSTSRRPLLCDDARTISKVKIL